MWLPMQSLAQLISVVFDSSKSTIIAGAAGVILNLCSGYQPTLESLTESTFGKISLALNPCRWALEGLWLIETRGWTPVYSRRREAVAETQGWKVGNLQNDIIAMLVLTVAIRLVVLFALYRVNSNKQI